MTATLCTQRECTSALVPGWKRLRRLNAPNNWQRLRIKRESLRVRQMHVMHPSDSIAMGAVKFVLVPEHGTS